MLDRLRLGDLLDLPPLGQGELRRMAAWDRDRDELLLRPVVQVPFDLAPFGVLRFDQPATGGPQLVDRGLEFGGERGVAQDEAESCAPQR